MFPTLGEHFVRRPVTNGASCERNSALLSVTDLGSRGWSCSLEHGQTRAFDLAHLVAAWYLVERLLRVTAEVICPVQPAVTKARQTLV